MGRERNKGLIEVIGQQMAVGRGQASLVKKSLSLLKSEFVALGLMPTDHLSEAETEQVIRDMVSATNAYGAIVTDYNKELAAKKKLTAVGARYQSQLHFLNQETSVVKKTDAEFSQDVQLFCNDYNVIVTRLCSLNHTAFSCHQVCIELSERLTKKA